MRGPARRHAAAALLLTLIPLAAAACGQSSQGRANHDAEVTGCRLRAFERAEIPLLRREFNAGRLGTVQEGKRFLRTVGRRGQKSNFFDAHGKIPPWDRLTFAQKVAFDDWTNSDQVQSRLHDRLERLFEHVRATAKC